MPGSWYSIGSSMVMMLVRSDCTDSSAEQSVVVLPLPVGPTTRIMPCWCFRKALRSVNAAADEAKLLERRHAAVLIEDAQHHLLAVQRAQRRGAEVDVPAVLGGDAHAAVLGQALLRDVHARHDLETRDQSFVDPLGQVHDFLQQAVEAMADEDALFHRLDVHVRGAGLDRALHDQIDEIDDRRGFASFLEPRDRLAALLVGAARQRFAAALVARRARGRHVAGAARDLDERLVGIALGDRLEDVGAGRDHLLDAITGLELEVLHEAEEQRVGHRHREQVLFETDRDARSFERNVLLDQGHDGRVGRVLREVQVRKAELIREGLGDLAFGGQVQADEHRAQAFARALVFGQRRLQIVLCDEARLDQALTELFSHRSSENLVTPIGETKCTFANARGA